MSYGFSQIRVGQAERFDFEKYTTKRGVQDAAGAAAGTGCAAAGFPEFSTLCGELGSWLAGMGWDLAESVMATSVTLAGQDEAMAAVTAANQSLTEMLNEVIITLSDETGRSKEDVAVALLDLWDWRARRKPAPWPSPFGPLSPDVASALDPKIKKGYFCVKGLDWCAHNWFYSSADAPGVGLNGGILVWTDDGWQLNRQRLPQIAAEMKRWTEQLIELTTKVPKYLKEHPTIVPLRVRKKPSIAPLLLAGAGGLILLLKVLA